MNEPENGVAGDGIEESSIATIESDPTNQPEVITIEGVEFTAEDIKHLQGREKDFHKDYTAKTTKLKEDREALETEQKEVDRQKDLNLKMKDAYHKDVDYFQSHTLEDSKNYVSQQSILMGTASRTPQTEPVVDIANDPAVKALSKEISDMKVEKEEEKKSDFERDWNDAMGRVSGVIAKNSPLAQIKDVKNEIFVQYTLNKRIPSDKEIASFASERHTIQMKLYKDYGGKGMNFPNKDKNVEMPSSEGASTPPSGEDKPIPDITDVQAAIDSGRTYMDKKRDEREGRQ